MATVHSYARYSSMGQASGDSERRQLSESGSWVIRNGHCLSDLKLFDRGKSGFRGDKQEALQEFIRVMKSKDGRVNPGDIFLIENLDRLGRKGIRPTQDLCNLIFKHGLDIVILQPSEKIYRAKDSKDITGAIEISLYADAANTYSLNLSGRLKQFHLQARKEAYENKTAVNSGECPAWLTRKAGKFTIIPERAEAVKYIFQRTIEGIGRSILTAEMNRKFKPMGKVTIKKPNPNWNEAYVGLILTDRRCMGEYIPKMLDENNKRVPDTRGVIAGYFPEVISEETWLNANQSRANRRKEKGPWSEHVNLFTGLLYSPEDKCGFHVTSTSKIRKCDGVRVVYRRVQSESARNGVQGATRETLDLGYLENVLLHHIREIDLSIFDKSPSLAIELNSAVKEMEAKAKKLKELDDLITEDASNVRLLLGHVKKLESEIAELRTQINTIRGKSIHVDSANVEHIRTLLDMPNTTENRLLLREAIKRVVSRISILPVKLGSLQRSPVGAHVEIELLNGGRRSVLMLREQSVCYYEPSPDSPGLTERSDLDKHQGVIMKALKSVFKPVRC